MKACSKVLESHQDQVADSFFLSGHCMKAMKAKPGSHILGFMFLWQNIMIKSNLGRKGFISTYNFQVTDSLREFS